MTPDGRQQRENRVTKETSLKIEEASGASRGSSQTSAICSESAVRVGRLVSSPSGSALATPTRPRLSTRTVARAEREPPDSSHVSAVWETPLARAEFLHVEAHVGGWRRVEAVRERGVDNEVHSHSEEL
ncbi:hypothetical protein EYF80_053908 [Liparis tanakae]|uniref:Uncharacterized protein n=1 Tax=Liparis tanakae TaxID=230148 RepID=A0A4Z2F434_9TELE|nr:hypothetical protein EYF80_053908 [Liparis tanakae]